MKFLISVIKSVLKLLGNPVQDVPQATPTPPPMPKINPVTNEPVPKKPSHVYRIGLSPGHGGSDTGAVSATGLKEAVVARTLCDKMLERFDTNRAFDTKVYDYGISESKNYRGRVDQSNARKDEYYIPIHFNNWAPKPHINGWLVFVDPQDAEKNPYLFPMCKEVLNELQKAYALGFRDWGDDDRDGYMAGIGRKVYEETAPKADTIYLECGFLSNPDWDTQLRDDAVITKLANAIVTAFEKFLKVEEFRS